LASFAPFYPAVNPIVVAVTSWRQGTKNLSGRKSDVQECQ
jgi:hypothetical protein